MRHWLATFGSLTFLTFLEFSVLQASDGINISNTQTTAINSGITQATVHSSTHQNINQSNFSTATSATQLSTTHSFKDPEEDESGTGQHKTAENVSVTGISPTTQSIAVNISSVIVTTPNSAINSSKSTKGNIPESTSETQTVSHDLTTGSENESQSGTPILLTTPDTRPKLDKSWMDYFTRVHHFDGIYEYDGGQYSFDFVIMYVHPVDIYTLVAKFFDQDGAIIELNGTSTNGYHIIFRQSNTYSADFRFTALSGIELDGILVRTSQRTYYTGNITQPVNSSFTWFHMNKGLGSIVTGDATSTRTAIIIVIPASLAFLAIIGTTATLCWASKKGLFGRRHKSYLLFKDNPVSYESEAETIHI